MELSIDIKNLSGGYKNKRVLNNINLSFNKSTFTAIAGPNGCGKSTLLKYIIKELETDNGKISILGKDINLYSHKALANKLAFVSQSSHCESPFTVYQLVRFGRYCHKDRNDSIVRKAMETVGISDLAEKEINEISGGEFQLAMLARAICQNTEILVLDEPANNLDPVHQKKMMSILKGLSENGKTVICVIHDLNSALEFCTDTVLMKAGTIFTSGKTENIITKNNVESVYECNCELVNLTDGRLLLTFCCNHVPQPHLC